VALFLATTAYIPVQRAAMVADRVGLTPISRRLFGAVLSSCCMVYSKKKEGPDVERVVSVSWQNMAPSTQFG
jgi:hypothetical protein